jgi:ribosomal protein S18 acetylase RimI-like enzyme
MQQTWTKHADNIISQDKATGLLRTKDEAGNPILLVWEKVPTQSERLNEIIKGVSDILVNTYTQIELQFAKQFPDKVATEFFLQSLAPMFAESGTAVDWTLAEAKIKQVFQQFFATADFAAYTKPDEIFIFVIALNQVTGEPLGLLQFQISPEYDYGTVKACYFGVRTAPHNPGIEKLMLAAIFNILPTTTRIFLHTRSTNTEAIGIYRALGFSQFGESMPHWPDFEYLALHSCALQLIANEFA